MTTRQAYNIGVHPAPKTRLGYIIFLICASLFLFILFLFKIY